MKKKNRALWVVLFLGVALLLSILATGWNIVLVRHYQSVARLVSLSLPSETVSLGPLVAKMIAGTLGFVAVLALTLLLFVKLLNEMRLNQAQSEFLAMVSHELKTPIASIELTSSLLKQKTLTPQEMTLWSSHGAELKRLKQGVNDLLDAAKWQSKSPGFHRKVILLEEWITQSLPQWQNTLGLDARLTRTGDRLEASIFVDPKLLERIFENLLSNAKKFAREALEVEISTHEMKPVWPWRKKRWRIEIRDNGWGFDPQDTKRIFTRFFRSKSGAPYAIPGTGLGLYLAASAGRSMGLLLTARSLGKNDGAVFVVEGKSHS